MNIPDCRFSVLERDSSHLLLFDEPVLFDSSAGITLHQLSYRRNQIANALIGLGIQPNQCIAILARNSGLWEFYGMTEGGVNCCSGCP